LEEIKILLEVILSMIVGSFLLILALPLIIIVLIIDILVSFVSFLKRVFISFSQNKL